VAWDAVPESMVEYIRAILFFETMGRNGSNDKLWDGSKGSNGNYIPLCVVMNSNDVVINPLLRKKGEKWTVMEVKGSNL
jgi:hypothetical protein